MKWTSTWLALTLATVSLGLAACGTISRPEDGVLQTPVPLRAVADPRINARDSVRLRALEGEIVGRMSASGDASILSISGGGANGAYGAGVIVGWTKTGDRPSFPIVTGVSTGALTAPFAFLGPDWDDELAAAYAGGQAHQLLNWRRLAALVAPSLYSPTTLRDLIQHSVTPQMLSQIAAEHAKGRRLLVVTTNLDTEETIIWDMGLIATQGGPQGLRLFRDVLLASASIPGVFPPVIIGARSSDGRVVGEMHVDGGVNTPFLAVPEGLLLWTAPSSLATGSGLYVLVNSKVAPDRQITRGRLPDILRRSYDSGSKASLRAHLAVNVAFAKRNGMAIYVASIPSDLRASSLDFNQNAMRALFEAGRNSGMSGQAWRSVANLAEPSSPSPSAPGPSATPPARAVP